MTMIVTPFLINMAPRIAEMLSKIKNPEKRKKTSKPQEVSGNQVILCGYGLTGRHLTRVLKAAHIAYIIVELNGKKTQQARAAGEPVIYGDATQREVLLECGIAKASVAVLAFGDPIALRQSVCLTRDLNPEIHILVSTQHLTEIEELRSCGANEVVAQEFETSIEIVTMVLSRLHIPSNVIRAQSKLLREDGYEMLRSPAPVQGISQKVMLALAEGTTETFLLSPDHNAVGKTIINLGLRQHTGSSIIAVVKGSKSIPNPSTDYVFESGDVLVLVGSHAQIESAFVFLEK